MDWDYSLTPLTSNADALTAWRIYVVVGLEL